MNSNFKLIADNLHFSEGPRWKDGKLWFSDFYHHAVMTADEMGNVEKIVDVPNQPSGLGWLPNGDLIIVSMLDRKLLKFKDGNLTEHADMSKLTPFRCNDMVVDKNGNAYVGNFGSIMGTPIINQPQVGIIAIGVIRKLPSVIETDKGDFVGIRKKLILSHTYDHRIINGSIGGNFVKRVAEYLEEWDMNQTI